MKLNIEPIKNWFGFTRRERRASSILLIIIVFVLGFRVAVPEKNLDLQDITGSISLYTDLKESEAEPVEESNTSDGAQSEKTPAKRYNSGYQKKPLINLNSCDTSQLIALPGIGPVLSVRIVKYRNLLGGFASVDQLSEVYGLPAETFTLIKERVFADTSLLIKIDINSADYRGLKRLPYFESYEVTAILKYRELNGRIGGMNELTDNKLISADKVSRIRPYLNFN